eukprot:jgi/Botrbrau1/4774/Bobra.0137s0046.1
MWSTQGLSWGIEDRPEKPILFLALLSQNFGLQLQYSGLLDVLDVCVFRYAGSDVARSIYLPLSCPWKYWIRGRIACQVHSGTMRGLRFSVCRFDVIVPHIYACISGTVRERASSRFY